jgi:endogenous inhibitor of DNA gyrase (YacG/DUF329 family)
MRHRCPNCRKVINRALLEQSRREKFYPFCCERCKFIDLGRWLDAKYSIVSELKDQQQEEGHEENSGQRKGDRG